MSAVEDMMIDIRAIKSMLTDYIAGNYHIPKPARRLAMHEIARIVGGFFDITIRQLKSDYRTESIMMARHITKYIMIKEFFYTKSQVAEYIKCSRTNLYNSLHKVDGWLETEDRFKKMYSFCMEEVVRVSKIPV